MPYMIQFKNLDYYLLRVCANVQYIVKEASIFFINSFHVTQDYASKEFLYLQ